jgi:hypothetical protein
VIFARLFAWWDIEYFPSVEIRFQEGVNHHRSIVGSGVEHPHIDHEPQGVKPGDQVQNKPQRVVDRSQQAEDYPIREPYILLFFILPLNCLGSGLTTLKLMKAG